MRPSELFGLDSDSIEAYCLDRAVGAYGNALSSALEASTEKCKTTKEAEVAQMRVLRKWIPEAGGPKFRDPAAR